jgi:hypothetical protein
LKNSPWFDALLDPAGILLIIGSVISGLLAAWWMFPAGIFLWLIMVVKTLRDPSLRINNAIQNRSELSQRYQNDFNKLQKSQVSFFNTIQSSEPGIQRELMPINEAITQLLDVVYENCKRYSLLENHRLVSDTDQKLNLELNSIDARLATVNSDEERSRLETMRKSLRDKMAQQQNVNEQLDRYSEKLAVLQNQLDGFITDALQAQSTGEEELKQILPETRKKIAQLTRECENG